MPILMLGHFNRPRKKRTMGDLILKSGQSDPRVVNYSLPATPAAGLLDKWKSDLIFDWKAQYDSTFPYYGRGLVDGKGGTWDQLLLILSGPDQAAFSNPYGEVTTDWIDAWKKDFATRSTTEDGIPIIWYRQFTADRNYYLSKTSLTKLNTMAIQGSTISLMSEQAAGKYSLDVYGNLLKNYSDVLTQDEKDFLKYFIVDWRIAKTDADSARADEIFKRIHFDYTPPSDDIQKLTVMSQAAHDAYIASGGTEEAWRKLMPNTSTETTVISNGGGNGITSVDWNQVQANQKVVTDMKDSTMISPLQTMFLKPDTKQQTAAASTQVDFSKAADALDISQTANQISTAAAKVSPVTWLAVGYFALKLFGR